MLLSQKNHQEIDLISDPIAKGQPCPTSSDLNYTQPAVSGLHNDNNNYTLLSSKIPFWHLCGSSEAPLALVDLVPQ